MERELEGVEVKTHGGVRWPESYVATSRQPLSTEWQIRGARCLFCLFATLSSLVRGKERKRKGGWRGARFFPTRGESLKHRVRAASDTHTHTHPSSDLSITDPRTFPPPFELILSSRIHIFSLEELDSAE